MKAFRKLNKIKSLSIVFPLFNESKRLKTSIKHIESFLKKKTKLKLEFIFVDDGSTDNSSEIIKKFIKKYYKFSKNKKIKLSLLKSIQNKGKGSALKLGVKKASHDWILTHDIDMSVSLFQFYDWLKKGYICKHNCAYFGSRRSSKSILDAQFYRQFMGYVFSFFANLILNIDVDDTQCGFKLYKKSDAKFAFSRLKNYGFSHDLEIVLLLNSKNIDIVELPIKWVHKNNSQLNLLLDPIKMFIEILLIRINCSKYL